MRTVIGCFLLAALWSNLHAQSNVQEAWVRHYGSGLVPGDDVATAIAVDNSGNVYVTGYSPTVPYGYDYATIKYDATGRKVWVAKYNGPGNGDDQPVAMAADNGGNVYVTGSSYVSSSDVDYATVKYNSAGVQQWVSHYRSLENLLDKPQALAIDGNGNVYVTGTSRDAITGETGDYVTVKYNSTGEEEWARRYNGPANRNDHAVAIAVDASGSVHVTGSSRSGGEGSNIIDYATIKYDSTGVVQWIARFNNTGFSADEPAAIALDGAGNVYVAGTVGIASYGAYATVKYNADGVQQWVARYRRSPQNFAVALAIDGLGNVYVTGRSGLDLYDFATVKYNADGVQQWEALYDGSLNSNEEVSDLAVDATGNVYVTGKIGYFENSFATVKYDSGGVQQWISRYDGVSLVGNPSTTAHLAVDVDGNVHVVCSIFSKPDSLGLVRYDLDYTTIKCNSAGAEQWVAHYDESRVSFDRAAALAIDASGNVYVTGMSEDSNSIGEYATIKYDSEGEQKWIARNKGQSNVFEVATAIAVDDVGNVYVTGSSENSATSADFVTVKYNPEGAQLWEARYDSPSDSYNKAADLAVDDHGNVYVTGKSGTSYVTVKYNSAGTREWVRHYAANDRQADEPTDLVLDATGNVYIAGNTATIKYNSAGQEKWAIHNISASAIAVDPAGEIYVTGASQGNYVTTKFDSAGKKQWEALYSGGFGSSAASAITLDRSGNVYVTGQSRSESDQDYATIKYNSLGVEQWVARYNSHLYGLDAATAIALDNFGNVYVTGTSSGGRNEWFDYATVKYNPGGDEVWVARYRGPGGSIDEAIALGLDSGGNVYVSGLSEGMNGGGWKTYTTVKYVQTPVSVGEKEYDSPNSFGLFQNYPNPFNPSTTIRYALAKPERVTLKIFNLAGQEVATLVNAHQPAGEHSVDWNAHDIPSGIYVYRLQAGDFVGTKKLILLR